MSVLSGKIADVSWGSLYLEIKIGAIGPTENDALKQMHDPHVYFYGMLIDEIIQGRHGQILTMHHSLVPQSLKNALFRWPLMRFLMRASVNCADCGKIKSGRVFMVRRNHEQTHICKSCNAKAEEEYGL